MSGTSSAVPAHLIRFAEQVGDLDDRLLKLAGPLGDALDAFRASHSEFAPPIPQLDETLRHLARRGRALDERVGSVGRAFADADGGRSDRPVSIAALVLGPVGLLPPALVGEVLDGVKDVADWIKDVGGPAGPLSELLHSFPRQIEMVIAEATELWRHTHIVVDEVLDGVVRQVEISIDEFLQVTRWMGRTIDLAWLRSAAPWLKRGGKAADFLAFPLAAWDQRDDDADRADLTATERALRAGIDGAGRGFVQWGIGRGAAAAVVALAPFGPPGWAAAGAVIAAAVVVGAVADHLLEDFLDAGYERLDWLVEDIAGVIDDSGRWIGDRAQDVGQWAGYRVDDVRGAAEDAQRWVGDRFDDMSDVAGALTPW